MPRTTSDLVKDALMDDYGPRADGTLPDLTQKIAQASRIIDRVVTCAISGGIPLTVDEAKDLETYLAAHLYAISDKPYGSRSTKGASASFHGQTGMRLEFTAYGQTAMTIDPSGCLEKLNKRAKARAVWIGRPPSEQTAYTDRD